MKRNKPKPKGTVAYGTNGSWKKNGRRTMNLAPRTVEISRDNFDAALESFLRATDVIHDSETPTAFQYTFDGVTVKVNINFKQEDKGNGDHTVH